MPQVNSAFAPGTEVAFADFFPILLTSEVSSVPQPADLRMDVSTEPTWAFEVLLTYCSSGSGRAACDVLLGQPFSMPVWNMKHM